MKVYLKCKNCGEVFNEMWLSPHEYNYDGWSSLAGELQSNMEAGIEPSCCDNPFIVVVKEAGS